MKRLFMSLLLLNLCGCSVALSIPTQEYDYSDANKIEWSVIFDMDPESYLVYFYKTTCGHCNEIKSEILEFYFKYKDMMYFVECDEYAVYGNPGDLTLISDVNDFYIFGTPFLIFIKNATVKEYFAGVSKIRDFIANY